MTKRNKRSRLDRREVVMKPEITSYPSKMINFAKANNKALAGVGIAGVAALAGLGGYAMGSWF